jgi:hypothetical protein
MRTLLFAFVLMAPLAHADTFGEGDYSTDGFGVCFRGTACSQDFPWNQDPSQPKKSTTWGACIANGGPISWMNQHGKCLYRDPGGD